MCKYASLVFWLTECLDKCSDACVWEQAYPVFFGKSFHFLVEEKVDSQSVTGAVGEDGAENLTVLVVHLLGHVHQHRLVDFLDVDPEQSKGEVIPKTEFKSGTKNILKHWFPSTCWGTERLCSCSPAGATNPPSPGEYWDACWDPAREASSGDRWQLKKGRLNIQSQLILFFTSTDEHEIHRHAVADKKPEQRSVLTLILICLSVVT